MMRSCLKLGSGSSAAIDIDNTVVVIIGDLGSYNIIVATFCKGNCNKAAPWTAMFTCQTNVLYSLSQMKSLPVMIQQ